MKYLSSRCSMIGSCMSSSKRMVKQTILALYLLAIILKDQILYCKVAEELSMTNCWICSQSKYRLSVSSKSLGLFSTTAIPIMSLRRLWYAYLITAINCDGEFNPVLTPFESQLEASINSCMPDEHVPETERNNRVIQERVRIVSPHAIQKNS